MHQTFSYNGRAIEQQSESEREKCLKWGKSTLGWTTNSQSTRFFYVLRIYDYGAGMMNLYFPVAIVLCSAYVHIRCIHLILCTRIMHIYRIGEYITYAFLICTNHWKCSVQTQSESAYDQMCTHSVPKWKTHKCEHWLHTNSLLFSSSRLHFIFSHVKLNNISTNTPQNHTKCPHTHTHTTYQQGQKLISRRLKRFVIASIV